MTTDLATPKQTAFLTSLIAERSIDLSDLDIFTLSKKDASMLIDALLKTPKTVAKKAAAAPKVNEAGFYIDSSDTIFKVQRAVHGSGNLYAKQLTDDGEFIYIGRKPLYKDDMAPLTLEKAKTLGRLYGICVCCGATLTDEGSIAAGIGPVCGKRLVA